MSSANRVAWGHALTQIGVAVRRGSFLLAVLASVLIVASATQSPAGLEPVLILALPALTFVLARASAIGLAAAGWMMFPPEHRAVLAELGAQARFDA